jgi:hypothetical protein
MAGRTPFRVSPRNGRVAESGLSSPPPFVTGRDRVAEASPRAAASADSMFIWHPGPWCVHII